ncbi:MAG: neutral zinc metallopeptidase [Propionibacteriaceae bacterium]|jgi:predicted metalloprotease|nr:neutral zinc metallopeptidase [Propionibacteriaceae bacterium]
MSAQVPQGYPPAARPQGAPGWGTQQAQWGAPGPGQQFGQVPQAGYRQPGYPQQYRPASQQFGYPQQAVGGYVAPPTPKSNAVLKIILAIVAVPLVVLGVLIVIGLVVGPEDPYTPPPTSRTTTTTTSTTRTTTQPSATTTTQPTATLPEGEWVNEDYVIPNPDANPSDDDVPWPDTYGDATQMLETNSLYGLSVPVPVRCELPRVDVSALNDAELQDHLNILTGCLQRVWDPTLGQIGARLPRPTVTVYGGTIDTPCGESDSENAFYCTGNQQVYFANDLVYVLPRDVRSSPFIAEAILAHEMGHAVQFRTGLLISANAWEQQYDKQGNERESLRMSRRTELQADCLAGAFFQSVELAVGLTETDAENLSVLFYNLGDDVLTGDPNYVGNHGHGQSRVNWFFQGASQTSLKQCATYLAGEGDIV